MKESSPGKNIILDNLKITKKRNDKKLRNRSAVVLISLSKIRQYLYLNFTFLGKYTSHVISISEKRGVLLNGKNN